MLVADVGDVHGTGPRSRRCCRAVAAVLGDERVDERHVGAGPTSSRARFEPMKPSPPVISTRLPANARQGPAGSRRLGPSGLSLARHELSHALLVGVVAERAGLAGGGDLGALVLVREVVPRVLDEVGHAGVRLRLPPRARRARRGSSLCIGQERADAGRLVQAHVVRVAASPRRCGGSRAIRAVQEPEHVDSPTPRRGSRGGLRTRAARAAQP